MFSSVSQRESESEPDLLLSPVSQRESESESGLLLSPVSQRESESESGLLLSPVSQRESESEPDLLLSFTCLYLYNVKKSKTTAKFYWKEKKQEITVLLFSRVSSLCLPNEERHIVLVWFFLPLLLLPLLLLLLSEACPDHNCFVFPYRSIVFGMWVHDHKAVCCIL